VQPPYLEFDVISKRFPGVQALDAVSLAVRPGSVHALIGENGAGKSTLLKVLSGLYRPETGTLRLAGRPRTFHSARDAIRAGIAVIYQELQLVPEMTVAENLQLGNMPARFGLLNRKALRAAARDQLAALGEDLDPSARVNSLPIAQRQMVEIAKALLRNASVIAFDEPTSSLSDREVQKLFAIIRQLKDHGRAMIYVSHRLKEIFEVCDSATVFRDGKRVETFDDLAGVAHDTLVNRMVGRSITDIYQYRPRPLGRPALEIAGLSGPGLVEPATLSVAQGEIVGLFGLVGAGRTELLKLIFGAVPARSGTVRTLGKPVIIRSPRDAIRNGLAFCPEDRKAEAIVPVRSVAENINLTARRNFSRLRFLLDDRRERDNAHEQIRRLDIRTPSLQQPIMNLSGGNQQKAILARWLSQPVKVMLLDEPTRGIDVGAKSEIYAILNELARSGVALLVASSELPEVLGISDRILVMRQARIVASVPRDQATEQNLLTLALPQDAGGASGRAVGADYDRDAGETPS
jgi:L-arabinose transport system ATP-binding protein